MKNLSISLFAVLAIAVAVTSAFTTKSSKKANNTYEIWGINPQQITNSTFSPLSSTAKFDAANNQINFVEPASSATSPTLQDILDSRFETCTGSAYVCAVRAFLDNTNLRTADGTGAQIVEVKLGELTQ